jgi:anhydro-N-acetylmuramic acid kinase
MNKSSYKVIGVMSGTSLDGIDLAECFFTISKNDKWKFKIGEVETVPYPANWKTRLQEAIHFSEGRLRTLNEEYTQYLAGVISAFIDKHSLEDLDAVCSHGHTILHRPEKRITLQIGNLPHIATLVEQIIVCDFRVQDVVMGGQGAPLVPIGDRLLFNNYDYCLNLGGFANCSFEKEDQRIAYDICPVNIVLNHYAEKLDVPFDKGGQLAAGGSLDSSLLEQLNALSFYKQVPPKSLGLERVQQEIFPLLIASANSAEKILHTFTEHVAMQLATQFYKHSSILVTGGGAYNRYLLERFKYYKDIDLEVPDSILTEYKEALVFGLLGVLRLRDEVNCLASVTGAREDHSSGVILVP